MDNLPNKPNLAKTGLWLVFALLLIGGIRYLNSNPGPQTLNVQGATMGTYYSITVWGEYSTDQLNQAKDRIDQRLDELNAIFSTYDQTSEISKINQQTPAIAMSTSESLAYVFKLATEISQASNGAFDPTVGPLVNLWGFGVNKDREEPPEVDQINLAKGKVGLNQFVVSAEPTFTLIKSNKEVALDLSAIAKGYAVDELSKLLTDLGFGSHLVDIGGEVKGVGRKGDKPWRVGIEDPKAKPGEPKRLVVLTDMAIATSGDYRNYFEHKGKRYSHVIDPRTGYPVENGVVSASVMAPRCDYADGWATALMVMSEQERNAVIEQLKLSVYLIIAKPDGSFEEVKTGLFSE